MSIGRQTWTEEYKFNKCSSRKKQMMKNMIKFTKNLNIGYKWNKIAKSRIRSLYRNCDREFHTVEPSKNFIK